MSNRRKPAANIPIRQALLHVLDVEYARAAKARNLARMEEIAAIVAQLQGIWTDIPQQQFEAVVDPEPPVEPEAPQQPAELPPLELPEQRMPREHYELSELMAAVDAQEPVPEPPAVALPAISNGEGDRRRAARAAVRQAVADVNRVTADEQFRYELSLLAQNSNVEAMHQLQDVAAASGLPVREYASRTIAIHNGRRRRAAQVYAIEAQALKDIDAASGDGIDAVAAKAVEDIRGNDE